MTKILIVDDDVELCRSLELQFISKGYETCSAYDASSALSMIDSYLPDMVLLDLNLPDLSGIKALPQFIAGRSKPVVVFMTADPDNQVIVEAMRAGAFDYLRKPFKREALYSMMEKAAAQRQRENKKPQKENQEAHQPSLALIGSHPKIIEIHKRIGLLARSRVTVLVYGESGTGKELAARILHEADSPEQPFVAINCSSVVPTLLESEFFGHEKGSFTGADRLKIGKLEHADGGTVFLDEIGDLSIDLQGKLLRVLQEEEFVRVGGLETIPLGARIIAATNKDLKQLVTEGKFRGDLYYRLTVATLSLPPLRERREDISQLVHFLLKKISSKLQFTLPTIADEAVNLLAGYDWPGNVRELENVLTRAVALASEPVLSRDYFEQCLVETDRTINFFSEPVSLAEAERRHIEKILAMTHWNMTQSARLLAISPTTLRKKIHDYEIHKPEG